MIDCQQLSEICCLLTWRSIIINTWRSLILPCICGITTWKGYVDKTYISQKRFVSPNYILAGIFHAYMTSLNIDPPASTAGHFGITPHQHNKHLTCYRLRKRISPSQCIPVINCSIHRKYRVRCMIRGRIVAVHPTYPLSNRTGSSGAVL
jgi:hypothetical protein